MTTSSKRNFAQRLARLSAENGGLQEDISQIQDALNTHHSLQAGENSGVREVIRNEVGGPRWEHGGRGKLHKYSSPEHEASAADTSSKLRDQGGHSRASSAKQNGVRMKGRGSPPQNTDQQAPKARDFESLEPSVSKIGSDRSIRSRPLSGNVGKKSTKTEISRRAASAGRTRTMDQGDPNGKPVVNLNETYTKDTLGNCSYVLPSADDCRSTNRGRDTCSSTSSASSEKRAKVLKKMIKKLDVDMRLSEYRTSETESGESTPRCATTEHDVLTEKKSPHYCDPDVMAWLLNQNLKDTEKYARIFADHEVDMESLTLMTEAQLREMGVSALGALSKLVNAIRVLRGEDDKSTGKCVPKGQNGRHTYKVNISKAEEDKAYKPYQRSSKPTVPVSDKQIRNGASETNKTNGNARLPMDVKSAPQSGKASASKLDSVKKGASKSRPASAVVSGSTRSKSTTSRARPMSAVNTNDRAHNDSTAKSAPPRLDDGKDNVDSTRTRERVAPVNPQGSALSGLMSVRSYSSNRAATETKTDVQEDNEVFSGMEPEERLQEVEGQIQDLQKQLTSPVAMEIIAHLQSQIKDIQGEITAKKAQGQRSARKQESGMPRNNSKPSDTSPKTMTGEAEVLSRHRPRLSESDPTTAPSEDDKKAPASGVASMSMSKTALLKEVRKQKDAHRKQIRHLESELSRLKHKDPVRSCEIPEADIKYKHEDMIGEGAFSQVFRGHYQGSEVAIKQLKVPLSSQDKNYFAAEVSLLHELRHPRVVLLLGVCTAARLPLMVLEYMARGSLYSHLHDTDSPPLDHAAYYQVAKDMALGMNYLHRHTPAVLHLDLKSMNVLLTSSLRAKIADFGFSKLRHDADQDGKKQPPGQRSGQRSPGQRPSGQRSGGERSVKGTPAWMAPELLTSGDVSTKCDVYSYSIILWEMLTREHPYSGCTVFQVIERTRTNKRLQIPASCPPGLRDLLARCWNNNPARRPSFKDVLSALDKLHLPENWRSLFASAGIPRSALDDVASTRTLIDLVSTTLEDVPCGVGISLEGLSPKGVGIRPEGVPLLELVDTAEVVLPDYLLVDCEDDDWEDVTDDDDTPTDNDDEVRQRPEDVPKLNLNLSGDHVVAATFRKDSQKSAETLKPPSYVPPPPPVKTDTNGQAHKAKPKKVISDVRESFLDELQNRLHDKPAHSTLATIHSDDALRPKSQVGGQKSNGLDLRPSELQSQKRRLRPPRETPAPGQLQDLSDVPQHTIQNLCDILRKAVNQRRMHIVQGDSLDKSLTQSGWSLEDD